MISGINLRHALNDGWLIYAGTNERSFNQCEFFQFALMYRVYFVCYGTQKQRLQIDICTIREMISKKKVYSIE